jgi:hypothetical protein
MYIEAQDGGGRLGGASFARLDESQGGLSGACAEQAGATGGGAVAGCKGKLLLLQWIGVVTGAFVVAVVAGVAGVVSENGFDRAAVAFEYGGDALGGAAGDVGDLGGGGLIELEKVELAVIART